METPWTRQKVGPRESRDNMQIWKKKALFSKGNGCNHLDNKKCSERLSTGIYCVLKLLVGLHYIEKLVVNGQYCDNQLYYGFISFS